MTVARMREELSNEEFVYWSIYFARKAQRRRLEYLMAQGAGR
ncbi:hypothetical protein ACN26Y_29855 [Micromonospora sp. WMMD558]